MDRLGLSDVYHNLGVVYDRQSRLNEASLMYNKSLRIRERLLGKEHYITSLTLENLAMVYCDKGKHKEASEMQLRVVNTRKKQLGEHPKTAQAFHNMGQIYCASTQWNNAMCFFRKAASMRETLFGAEHPDTEESRRWVMELKHKQQPTAGRPQRKQKKAAKDPAVSLYTKSYRREGSSVPPSERECISSFNSSLLSQPSLGSYKSQPKDGNDEPSIRRGVVNRDPSAGNAGSGHTSAGDGYASVSGTANIIEDDNPYSLYRRKNIPYSVSLLGSTL